MSNQANHARSKQNRQRKAERLQQILQLKKKAKNGNQKAINEAEKLQNQKELRQQFDAFMGLKPGLPHRPVMNQRQRRKLSRQMRRKVN